MSKTLKSTVCVVGLLSVSLGGAADVRAQEAGQVAQGVFTGGQGKSGTHCVTDKAADVFSLGRIANNEDITIDFNTPVVAADVVAHLIEVGNPGRATAGTTELTSQIASQGNDDSGTSLDPRITRIGNATSAADLILVVGQYGSSDLTIETKVSCCNYRITITPTASPF